MKVKKATQFPCNFCGANVVAFECSECGTTYPKRCKRDHRIKDAIEHHAPLDEDIPVVDFAEGEIDEDIDD